MVVVAIFLLLTTLAAALDPRPLRTPPPPAPAPLAPAEGGERNDARTVAMRLEGSDRRPWERRVSAGTHVVLTVTVDTPGEVALEGLEQVVSATPEAPAVFDLLATRPGRYPVLLTPVASGPRQLGALVIVPTG